MAAPTLATTASVSMVATIGRPNCPGHGTGGSVSTAISIPPRQNNTRNALIPPVSREGLSIPEAIAIILASLGLLYG
jgi:hypothetical protein